MRFKGIAAVTLASLLSINYAPRHADPTLNAPSSRKVRALFNEIIGDRSLPAESVLVRRIPLVPHVGRDIEIYLCSLTEEDKTDSLIILGKYVEGVFDNRRTFCDIGLDGELDGVVVDLVNASKPGEYTTEYLNDVDCILKYLRIIKSKSL